MKCPECGKELTLIGEIGIHAGVPPGQKIAPKTITKNYTCVNPKCGNYKKLLGFKFDTLTGKLVKP